VQKPELKLYMAPDTCARVTLTALEHIGCNYEYETVAFLAGEHRSPEFLALNPNGAVPTLVAGGKALNQNPAILKYLNAIFPDAGLLPALTSPDIGYEVDALLNWVSADIHPKLALMRFPFLTTELPEAFENIGEKAAETLRVRYQMMETRLSGQDWVFGDQWSIIDAYLSWAWFRTVGSQIAASEFPNIDALSRRHCALPVAQKVTAIEAREIEALKSRGLFSAPKP